MDVVILVFYLFSMYPTTPLKREVIVLSDTPDREQLSFLRLNLCWYVRTAKDILTFLVEKKH